jgi:hypothetical protein
MMDAHVMLTLALVALLTLCIGALLAVRASLRADVRTLVKEVGGLRQEVRVFDAELSAVAREGYELNAKVEEHLLTVHPKPRAKPVPKSAAKKAPAKRSPAKKATPAKKASARAR